MTPTANPNTLASKTDRVDDLQWIIDATMNNPKSRRNLLVHAAIVWAISAVAITVAVLIAVSGPGGAGEWVIVAIAAIFALFMGAVGASDITTRKRLLERPDGIIGHGLRVLPDGAVELGKLECQPETFEGLEMKINKFTWNMTAKYSGTQEFLVNIMRTEYNGLMLSHILFTADAQEAACLQFVTQRNTETTSLWVAGKSRIKWLKGAAVGGQFASVSSILEPIRKRGCGQLMLTLTECADTSDVPKSLGVISGAWKVARHNALQDQANEQLAKNVIPLAPPDAGILAQIADAYGYKVVPNTNVNRFRGW